MKSFNPFLHTISVAALILISHGYLSAQDAPDLLAEAKPAYTLEEAQSYLKEVLPFVEKVSGKKFKTMPPIKLVNREGIYSVLKNELSPQLKNLYPGYTAEQIESMSASQAEMFSVSLLGKYGLDGTLYLLPGNISPVLKIMKIDDKYRIPVIKMLVAYELVHALQDQETDLKRLLKISDSDEMYAFNATIEGQAMLVDDLVGKAMGIEDSAIEMSHLFTTGAFHLDDSAQDIVRRVRESQYEQIYLGGRKFIEYHYQKGGNPRVWEIVAKPPLKTSMISKPETYSSERIQEKSLAVLFDGIDKDIGGDNWSAQNSALGEMVIRSAYAKMDGKNRDEIISNVSRIQVYSAQKENQASRVIISAIVLRQKEYAQKYIAILEDLVQQNIKEIGSSPSVSIENFAISDFTKIKADISRKIFFTVKMKDYDGEMEQVFYRIARGTLMIEFFFNQYEIKDETVAAIAEKIFKRYSELSR